MRALRLTIRTLVGLAIGLSIGLLLWASLRGRPQDLPWTPLDLGAPVGMATGRKLTALTEDFPQCRALLDRAGVRYAVLPPRKGEGQCGYADGIRLANDGARKIAFSPAGLGVACPVAAALSVWEWDVVQPAAIRHFGARVASIDHFGSY
ncbi:MAG: extensin, partial [Sphingomonas sp.]